MINILRSIVDQSPLKKLEETMVLKKNERKKRFCNRKNIFSYNHVRSILLRSLIDCRRNNGCHRRGICDTNILADIAIKIMSAPVTSAAIERSFSTFSWIHSKKRNRLSTERAVKIT
ncbi:unnamed protein product [Psylliodes chrysocephalus]|uniref:HAT C-terminal dimerisation domain-containing protein n=1 Tax=Psylliodes chrysocephalus TaxID=3402493 RepID=A0A9P0D244_9CUCU|nr:unnamed protein product [Psylliodes chrysocephala]